MMTSYLELDYQGWVDNDLYTYELDYPGQVDGDQQDVAHREPNGGWRISSG